MKPSIPVIRYHHVSPEPGLYTVSPSTFAEHMCALENHGWNTLSCDEFAACLKSDLEVPDKSLLITFDDGYLDNYIYAWPVLKRHQQQATLFLATGHIGNGPLRMADPANLAEQCSHYACQQAWQQGQADQVMLRWSEVKIMAEQGGFEFHSHGHAHRDWRIIDAGEFKDRTDMLCKLKADLAQSRGLILRHTGKVDRHLAWPWGYCETDYRSMAQMAGFTLQYGTHPGPNLPGDHPNFIRRFDAEDRPAKWLLNQLKLYRSWLKGTLSSHLGRH